MAQEHWILRLMNAALHDLAVAKGDEPDRSAPLQGATIGQRIKAAYLRAGLKRAKFARLCDVSYQTVINWENGSSEPKLENLMRVAEVTGFPVEQFTTAPSPGGMPAALRRALEIYKRAGDLTPSQIARIAALDFRGGPPTKPATYIAIMEHILDDGGAPVRKEETEEAARESGIKKVRRTKKPS
jgi:transcriptional regulator with XRE-family HTH domain